MRENLRASVRSSAKARVRAMARARVEPRRFPDESPNDGDFYSRNEKPPGASPYRAAIGGIIWPACVQELRHA